ncbi:hypothetical protein J3F84DRAFT_360658 [Trichoderma pleuroticola]
MHALMLTRENSTLTPVLFSELRRADRLAARIRAGFIPKIAHDGSGDYEAELTFVISKDGRHTKEDYVLGYTRGNDVCASAAVQEPLVLLQGIQ